MAAEAVTIVGDRASTALLHERLVPYAEQVITTRAHCLGRVAYYLGVTSAALDDPRSAQSYFRTAIELAVGLRSPFHRGRALLGLAEVLQSVDVAEARTLLSEAEVLAERYRMPGLLERARRLSR
jgi:hypothetical protein